MTAFRFIFLTRHKNLLLLLFLSAGIAAYSQTKTTTTDFYYADIAPTPAVKNLYVRSSSGPSCSNGGTNTIKKATLEGKIDLGADYQLGDAAVNVINCTVHVDVKGYSSLSGISIPLLTAGGNLTINTASGNYTPEQTFTVDFTSSYNTIDYFNVTVTIGSSTGSNMTLLQNNLHVNVNYKEEFYYAPALSTLLSLNNPGSTVTANPVVFSWNPECVDAPAPNYQLQLLRLYNNDPLKTSDEKNISAQIDWNDALTLETGSSATSFTLTLTEGTGYYVWRVRPIGTKYDGGIASDANWGLWSDAGPFNTQGAQVNDITPASSSPYLFFYQQFDEDKNWEYSRSFVEGDPKNNLPVTINEQISYSNTLQMEKQHQVKVNTTNNVLANQEIQDFSGRPALTTMTAPINQTYLGYKTGYIKNNNSTPGLYTASDFDTDGNYKTPSFITNSPVTDYYSDNNTADATIPDAQGYAFSRSLYFRDGTNRLKEQSSPGSVHTLKNSGDVHTTRHSYSSVADIELVRLFGDEAPADTSVYKEITIDANNTATIAYISKEGQTIATCMSKPTSLQLESLKANEQDQDPTHAPAGEYSSFMVNDQIKGNTLEGTNVIVSSKPVTFTEQTGVTLNYDITPGMYQGDCFNICNTCDYKVSFSILRVEDGVEMLTGNTSQIISPATCTASVATTSLTTTAIIPAGDYIIKRKVEAAVTNTLTGNTYYQEQENALTAQLNNLYTGNGALGYITNATGSTMIGTQTVSMATINNYLNNADIDGLNNYLGIAPSSTVTAVYVKLGCDVLTIPIKHCGNGCSPQPDYEQYLKTQLNTTDISTYLPGYTNTQFNTAIANMLAFTNTVTGLYYNCSDVWNCWQSVVDNYQNTQALYGSTSTNNTSGVNPTYPGLLKSFLNCTGYHLKGFTNTAFSTTSGVHGYLSEPYAYFNYTAGNNTMCEASMCCTNTTTTPPTVTSGCTCTNSTAKPFSSFNETDWYSFYQCISNSPPQGTPAQATSAANTNMDNCRKICNSRYDAFASALVKMYNNQSPQLSVQGFPYQHTTAGTTQNETLNLTGSTNPYTFTLSVIQLPVDVTHLTFTGGSGQAFTYNSDLGVFTSVDGSMITLDAQTGNGTITYASSSPGIATAQYTPYAPAPYDISLKQLYCQTRMLVDQCSTKCTLTTTSHVDGSGNTVIDQVGTAAEFQSMKEAMTYNFDVQLPDGSGNCAPGYEHIQKTESENQLIADYLNHQLENFRNNLNENTGNYNYLNDLQAFYPGISGLDCYSSMTVSPTVVVQKNEGSQFAFGPGSVSSSGSSNSSGQYITGVVSTAGVSYYYNYPKSVAPGAVFNMTVTITYTTSSPITILSAFKAQGPGDPVGGYIFNDGSTTKSYSDQFDSNISSVTYVLSLIAPSSITSNKVLETISTFTSNMNQGYSATIPNPSNGELQILVNPIPCPSLQYVPLPPATTTTRNATLINESNNYDFNYRLQYIYPQAVNINQTYSVTVNFISVSGNLSNKPVVQQADALSGSFTSTAPLNHSFSYPTASTVTAGTVLDSYTYTVQAMATASYGIQFNQPGERYNGVYRALPANLSIDVIDPTNASTTLCNSLCDQPSNCAAVCLKWIAPSLPPVTPTDGSPSVFTDESPVSCQQQAAAYIRDFISGQFGTFTNKHVGSLKQSYKDNCMNSAKLLDHFTAGYPLGYYHYTLYYYDRSGNLVKTVPPNGVNTASTSRLQHPSHTFITEYAVNSLHQIKRQKTPDGGQTQFWYNNKGQLRFSQNAKQLAMGNNTYSYTKYDPLGRVIEVGQASNADISQINVPTYPTKTAAVNLTQIISTFYTNPYIFFGPIMLKGRPQRCLQNRISYSMSNMDGVVNSGDDAVSVFSYDPQGNVEWMMQLQAGTGFTSVQYEYDLISGSMLKVKYNEGQPDQFFHRYTYDADKRLQLVETSRDNYVWDKDATYNYYPHGPLKRMELGEDHLQGTDYVYTIEGWLKGINHSALDITNDPAQDGKITNAPTSPTVPSFARDVYGTVLGYYAGDFKRTVGTAESGYNSQSTTANTYNLAGGDLFNGNISSLTSNIGYQSGNLKYEQLTGNVYQYDELNRLRTSTFQVYNGSSYSVTANNEYNETFTYDANGNIKTLLRNSFFDASLSVPSCAMDNLSYRYTAGTNQLLNVQDAVTGNTETSDIKNQLVSANPATVNYAYDETGNLKSDAANNISNIEWNIYGKVKTVIKTGPQAATINYNYDAAGRRIRKVVAAASGTVSTYYVLDATGNQLAVYTQTGTGPVSMTEQPIYGMERIGVNTQTVTVNSTGFTGSITPITVANHVDAASPLYVPVNGTLAFSLGWFAISFPITGEKKLNTTTATPANGDFSVLASNLTYNTALGLQGRGNATITDGSGNVLLAANCMRTFNADGTKNEVCVVYGGNNLLLAGSDKIWAGANTQCALMKGPGQTTTNLYYLFTIYQGVPYYHIIDLDSKTVVLKNQPVNAGFNTAGNTLKVLEDRTGSGNSQLYFSSVFQGNRNVCAIDILPIAAGPVGVFGSSIKNLIPSGLASGDATRDTEFDISPNASQMTVLNNKGSFQGLFGYNTLSSQGELYTYAINGANHDQLTLQNNYSLPGSTSSVSSLAYNASGDRIYFSASNASVVFLDANLQNLSLAMFSSNFGDLRRGANGKIYVPQKNTHYMGVITDSPASLTSISDVAANNYPANFSSTLTGYLPQYNHTIMPITATNVVYGATTPITCSIYKRVLKGKTYELKDYLQNVRVTISDMKLWNDDGDHVPEGGEFTANVGSYTNYYAYGSPQPKRSYNATTNTRGFGGQEKDNEIYGEGNAYTAEYWEYDPRLGRRWNVDPIVRPWESPYATFANNPIYFVDPSGLKPDPTGRKSKGHKVNRKKGKISSRKGNEKGGGWGGFANIGNKGHRKGPKGGRMVNMGWSHDWNEYNNNSSWDRGSVSTQGSKNDREQWEDLYKTMYDNVGGGRRHVTITGLEVRGTAPIFSHFWITGGTAQASQHNIFASNGVQNFFYPSSEKLLQGDDAPIPMSYFEARIGFMPGTNLIPTLTTFLRNSPKLGVPQAAYVAWIAWKGNAFNFKHLAAGDLWSLQFHAIGLNAGQVNFDYRYRWSAWQAYGVGDERSIGLRIWNWMMYGDFSGK